MPKCSRAVNASPNFLPSLCVATRPPSCGEQNRYSIRQRTLKRSCKTLLPKCTSMPTATRRRRGHHSLRGHTRSSIALLIRNTVRRRRSAGSAPNSSLNTTRRCLMRGQSFLKIFRSVTKSWRRSQSCLKPPQRFCGCNSSKGRLKRRSPSPRIFLYLPSKPAYIERSNSLKRCTTNKTNYDHHREQCHAPRVSYPHSLRGLDGR